jgi:amino acid transporter
VEEATRSAVGAPQTGANHEFAKTMRWWDGVIINMAMPAALFVSLGLSVGALGVWTAVALWGITATLAVLHSWCYTELAAMFPDKSGGISVYANEAWKRRNVFIGPLCTFSYWFAWSSSLAIYGLLIGSLVQSQWFPGATWSFYDGSVHVGLPAVIAIGVIVLGWVTNILGMRPAVWMMTAMAALMGFPVVVFILAPILTGGWGTSTFTHGSLTSHGWIGLPAALTWMFVMAWSVYGIEACASFVPEYKETLRDTRLAMRVSGLLVLAIYVLMPLGVSGLVGQKVISANPSNFYGTAFARVFGGGSWIMTICLIAGVLLMMLMTSADGGRVLYGSSRDGMTVRQLGELNKWGVPGRAMTFDLVLNVGLVLFLGNILSVLIAGNLGYVLMHVFAISGFLLLRRDSPNAKRPIRLAKPWLFIAGSLCIIDIALLYFGVTHSKITGYGGTRELLIGLGVLSLSIVLFAYRRRVQDKQPITLRASDEPTPLAPSAMLSGAAIAVGGGQVVPEEPD